MIFEDGDLILREMRDHDDDYSLVARWLSDEQVLEFYEGRDRPHTLEMAREAFNVPERTAEGETPCIIEYQGKLAGYLQFYPADVQEYHFEGEGLVYALDLFIGEPALWGRGLGTRLVCRLLRFLFEEKGASWVILDPHIDNARAIRAYEKCGFRKIKLLPGHERHEGKDVDCWLMGVRKN